MKFRPTLFQFESRENPSLPVLDPIGGTAPPSTDPVVVAPPVDPATAAADAAVAAANLALSLITPPAPPAPFDPLTANNSIYNVPLVP